MSDPPPSILRQISALQIVLNWEPLTSGGAAPSPEYLTAHAQMLVLLELAHPDDIIKAFASQGTLQNLATLLIMSDRLVEKKDQISSDQLSGVIGILHPIARNGSSAADTQTAVQIHQKLLPLLPPTSNAANQLLLNAASTAHPDILSSILPFADPAHQSHAALFQAARDNRPDNVAVLLSVSDPNKAIASRVSNLPLSPDADVVMRLFTASQVLAPHLSDDTWDVLKKKRVSIRPTHLTPIQAALKHPIDFPDIPEYKAYLLKEKLASQVSQSPLINPVSRSSKM